MCQRSACFNCLLLSTLLYINFASIFGLTLRLGSFGFIQPVEINKVMKITLKSRLIRAVRLTENFGGFDLFLSTECIRTGRFG